VPGVRGVTYYFMKKVVVNIIMSGVIALLMIRKGASMPPR
jgi:hypothetical protein